MEDSGNREKDALVVSVPQLLYQCDYRNQSTDQVISSLTTPIKRDGNNLFPPFSQF